MGMREKLKPILKSMSENAKLSYDIIFDIAIPRVSRQMFSVKGQKVNILSFLDHKVFVTTTPLCYLAQK